ncbi:2-hydroxyglutaryl-CoA dehydratase [Thermobrachium celere]|uniref:Activator of (R)-2-hydroxyglutaryl-CoA dehydratase n=1 Tax=Thermobrachium celere DSM 8682 TaxID=941824 RepID=R7RV22_9CLOT|nr:acyl-CoA dehydratase activase-related protein [Thermobrachium celere]GFR34659.1 2-hydroxyglutaryl-CoA dehydratase [Thermobrachium celere]CDF59360.1 Activator of (R)-2-hydroxyglutaryl-CoA dehydratase [Thermobrachium celere DSM 8682]
MIIGIPNALLNIKYRDAIQEFFQNIGVTTFVSPKTNKEILDLGVLNCVDEACLPVKVFHGHVEYLRDRCDFILVPRIMKLQKNEFICPKFCGLPEMIKYSLDIKNIIAPTIVAYDNKTLKKSLYELVKPLNIKKEKFEKAFEAFKSNLYKYRNLDYKNSDLKVLLLGHPYLIYDDFINMNIIKKLKAFGVSVYTEDNVDFYDYTYRLIKKPFWTFLRNTYNCAISLIETGKIDGIIYVSSFACGIDSFSIDLIKKDIGSFPYLVLKIDEHTGEAGIDTRLEAFVDLLKRRAKNEYNFSTLG